MRFTGCGSVKFIYSGLEPARQLSTNSQNPFAAIAKRISFTQITSTALADCTFSSKGLSHHQEGYRDDKLILIPNPFLMPRLSVREQNCDACLEQSRDSVAGVFSIKTGYC